MGTSGESKLLKEKNKPTDLFDDCALFTFPARWSFSSILGPLHSSSSISREDRNIVQLCTHCTQARAGWRLWSPGIGLWDNQVIQHRDYHQIVVIRKSDQDCVLNFCPVTLNLFPPDTLGKLNNFKPCSRSYQITQCDRLHKNDNLLLDT